jgi:hypothetical protein
MEFSLKALKDGGFVLGDAAKGEAGGQMTAERWKFQYENLRGLGILRGRASVDAAWTDRFCNPKKP